MKDWWMIRSDSSSYLTHTIHGVSDELHQVLQGLACSTMLVDDTNNFVDTRNFVFWFLMIYSPQTDHTNLSQWLFPTSNLCFEGPIAIQFPSLIWWSKGFFWRKCLVVARVAVGVFFFFLFRKAPKSVSAWGLLLWSLTIRQMMKWIRKK